MADADLTNTWYCNICGTEHFGDNCPSKCQRCGGKDFKLQFRWIIWVDPFAK